MSEHKHTVSGGESANGGGPGAGDAPDATSRPAEQSLPPQEVHRADGRIEHPRVRFQPSNPAVGGVLAIMAAAICFECVHYSLAWWFFRDREQYESRVKQSSLPPSQQPTASLPREPRLRQLDRVAGIQNPDVQLRLAVQEALLRSYGATKDEGFIHVPIARAMDSLVGRLPVRARQDARDAHDQGLIDAGDSNSGRMFRGSK